MVAGLYIGLVLFVLAIIALANNVKEIKTDPIIYGMEKHEFNSCTCQNLNGQFVTIDLEDYTPINKDKSGWVIEGWYISDNQTLLIS